jgi:hypothetical protein
MVPKTIFWILHFVAKTFFRLYVFLSVAKNLKLCGVMTLEILAALTMTSFLEILAYAK